jgi:hypothetical protein
MAANSAPFCLFTGLFLFTWGDSTSMKILHYWSQKTPCGAAQYNFQHLFSVNIRCAVFGNNVIGPHLLNEVQQPCITGIYWKRSNPVLENLPLAT